MSNKAEDAAYERRLNEYTATIDQAAALERIADALERIAAMNEPPKTQELMTRFIEEHADEIVVREQMDGKWGSYALTELPPKLAMRHAMRLLIQHRVFHRSEPVA